MLPMPAMSMGREEEVVAAAAARVGAAARGAFIGGGMAENRRWARGARWQARSEMGDGQPRGRKVASDGWEARGG